MEGRKEGKDGRTEGGQAHGTGTEKAAPGNECTGSTQRSRPEHATPRPTDRAGVRPPRRARPSTWVRIMNWANQELNDGDQR